MDVVAQLHLKLAQRREPLSVVEFRLQDLVSRLVHCVVVGAPFLESERFMQKNPAARL